MRILICAIALLVAGCATKPTPQQVAAADYGTRPTDPEAPLKRFMASWLKDPYSARYRLLVGPKREWLNKVDDRSKVIYGWAYCWAINAKNSFGGYTGDKVYLLLLRGNFMVEARTEDLGSEKLCAALAAKS